MDPITIVLIALAVSGWAFAALWMYAAYNWRKTYTDSAKPLIDQLLAERDAYRAAQPVRGERGRFVKREAV